MRNQTTSKSPTLILATKHEDKRANIPTGELRGFVADEEEAPKTVLDPRDPSTACLERQG
jgi:adenine-specific DNA-methyltransferase